MDELADLGIVVIGRNEGSRLVRCLESIHSKRECIVYVDSGSTDESRKRAREIGVDVIELDNSSPYSAARARNTGFDHLYHLHPSLGFVQFVDGDCEIASSWLKKAIRHLRQDQQLAMVCGRRRERYPERSIYNQLCDMEWNTPIGEARSCGGDCMVRVSAFAGVGGFNEKLIAGEEPELCWRLRRAGGVIRRLPLEMTIHDANLENFSQWWRRQVRAGHAAAENADLHGRTDRNHYVRAVISNFVYGAVIPTFAGAMGYFSALAGVTLFGAVYAQLFFRVRSHRIHRGDLPSKANLYALFTVVVKFPQVLGALNYIWRRKVLRTESRLIEYKGTRP